MKNELNKNPHYLLVYFNVLILSKAFKLNKVLHLNNNADNGNEESLSSDSSRPPSFSVYPTAQVDHSCQIDDYDADGELSIQENFYENSYKQRLYLNGYTTHSKYRYDLILFPRILELCLNFISTYQQEEEMPHLTQVKTKESAEEFEIKFKKFNTLTEQFSKRLLHLLGSCNFNIQILINQNFRHFFIDLIHKSSKQIQSNTGVLNENLNSYLKIKNQSMEHYFEILYFISLYDLNESLFDNLFKLIIDTEIVDKFLDSTSFNLKYLSQLLSLVIIFLLSEPYQNCLEFFIKLRKT